VCAVHDEKCCGYLTDADDGVVTIDDDTSEASMMRMMGFSDFNSTKVTLHDLNMTGNSCMISSFQSHGLVHSVIQS